MIFIFLSALVASKTKRLNEDDELKITIGTGGVTTEAALKKISEYEGSKIRLTSDFSQQNIVVNTKPSVKEAVLYNLKGVVEFSSNDVHVEAYENK